MLNRLSGILPNASEHGPLVDHMLEFCHWFMLVLFVGWTTYFLFAIWRFHKSRNPKADYHGVRSHASTHLEASVVLIEAVLLLGFALPLWGRRVTKPAGPRRWLAPDPSGTLAHLAGFATALAAASAVGTHHLV